jgi:hypothetical protein
LSAQCLGLQASPECGFQAARIKAKPFGWPAASLDPPANRQWNSDEAGM